MESAATFLYQGSIGYLAAKGFGAPSEQKGFGVDISVGAKGFWYLAAKGFLQKTTALRLIR